MEHRRSFWLEEARGHASQVATLNGAGASGGAAPRITSGDWPAGPAGRWDATQREQEGHPRQSIPLAKVKLRSFIVMHALQ